MAIYGYARVSSADQNLDRQLEALKDLGAKKIFQEKVSGKDNNREQLNTMLSILTENDLVIIKSLDRLSRNLKAFLATWEEIKNTGAKLQVLDPAMTLDANDPMSMFLVQILVAAGELERSMIRQRQREGIDLAVKRGAFTGRRPNQQKHDLIKRLWETGQMKAREIAEAANMSYAQTCKIIKELKNATPEII